MLIRRLVASFWVSGLLVLTFLSMMGGIARAQTGAEKATVSTRSRGDWIQLKGDAARTGCTDDSFSMPPALMWKYSTKALSQNPSSALAVEGVVYFCSERYVFALDSETGSLLWWQETEGIIRATPVLTDSLLCVPSDDKKLYAFRADSGAVEWIFPTNGALRSSPLFHDGKIYFGSDDGKVYCLSAANADVVWKYATGGEVLSSPAWSGDNLFVLSNDNYVYCLKGKSGQLYWRSPIAGTGQMFSTPAVGSGWVWVSAGKTLYGLRSQTGRVDYSISTGDTIVSFPVINKDTVFIGSHDGYLYAFDMKSGKSKWKTSLDHPVLSTPIIVGDTLLVGTEKGFVFGLQVKDGKIVWKYQINPGSKYPNNVAAEPTVSRGSLYVVGDDGALYGFKPWGVDLAPPVASDAKVKLKARDGSMVYYPLDSPDYLKSVPVPRLRGVPPIILSVTLADEGSGLDESSMSVSLNGEPRKVTFKPETGLLESELGPAVKPGVVMRPLPDGELTVLLSVKDWHGNVLEKKYRIIVDNHLPPPEAPEKSEKTTTSRGGLGRGRTGTGGGIGGGIGGGY